MEKAPRSAAAEQRHPFLMGKRKILALQKQMAINLRNQIACCPLIKI